MKTCTKCTTEKEITEFRKRAGASDGLNSQCRSCESAQKKEYYLNNKEEILLKNKSYSSTPIGRQKGLEYRRNQYEKRDKKTLKEKAHNYYIKNREKIKKQAAEYKKTAEGIASTKKMRIQRSLINVTSDNTVTASALTKLREVQSNCCYYCNLTLLEGSSTHLDHYVPLSKGGQHSIFNVVWSCASCNLKKGAQMPVEPLHKEHISSLTS